METLSMKTSQMTFLEDISHFLDDDYWVPGKGSELAYKYTYQILIAAALYIPVIYLLKKYMKNRPPMHLKPVLFVWNFTLSLLSFVGFLTILFKDTIIMGKIHYPEGNYVPASRKVIAIFALTKVFEFGDTIFLVLRHRPLMFLHVYHHLSVVIFTWYAQVVNVDFAHFFCWCNLAVHAIMYGYYAVSVYHSRNKVMLLIRPMITVFQILQMLAGFFISYAAFLKTDIVGAEHNCALFSLAMYGSYAYLFFLFFASGYCKNTPTSAILSTCTAALCLMMAACAVLNSHSATREMTCFSIAMIATAVFSYSTPAPESVKGVTTRSKKVA